jgi:hypothetical protein
MAIELSSNFRLFAQLPLDSRFQVADTTERDAIPSGERYEGLETYCVADQTVYRLVGGITNTHWQAATATFYVPYGSKQSSIDAGQVGELSVDDDYMYVCVISGGAGSATWKKIPLILNP